MSSSILNIFSADGNDFIAEFRARVTQFFFIDIYDQPYFSAISFSLSEYIPEDTMHTSTFFGKKDIYQIVFFYNNSLLEL